MVKTFTTFTDNNLFSKKQWIFPDKFVFYMAFIIPFILILLFYDLYKTLLNCKKYKYIILIIIVIYLLSHFISDFITAFVHCYYVDDSFSGETYEIKDGYLIIDTHVGYASCHHIFPSNWKDISDSTLLISATTVAIIPILLVYFFIKNPLVKLLLYFTILLLIFTVFTHKYAHEKLHNRYVPYFIDILLGYNLFLSPKKHQKHHIENNYNWSLLNGTSDFLFNFIIRNICNYLKKCPIEERQNNAIKYLKYYNKKDNIINIKFTGDIEGTFKCKLHENLFIEPI